MDKANVFRSGEFFMDSGDILHMLFRDETGVTMDVDLWSADTTTETVPDAPTALDASDITSVSFTANWYFNENTTGYYLDVATDSAFTAMVAGYNNLDVGNVNGYSVVGLSSASVYFYRVRAYNDVGTSGNSSSITVITSTGVITDVDGNVYTEIIIGTQVWLVENLKTTKYKDGTPIPNLTESGGVGELITSWDSSMQPYDVFTTSGNEITSAQNTTSENEVATTNLFNVVEGYQLILTLTYHLVSGIAPNVSLRALGEEFPDTPLVLNEGVNNFTIDVDGSGSGYLEVNNFGTLSSFSLVSEVTYIGWIDDTIGAMCWYNNDIGYKNIYGALYNWYAVNNAHGLVYLEREGIPETGWRVATQIDFSTLITELGGISEGGKLKEIGTTHWNSPNTGATNLSLFTALGAGVRSYMGQFVLQGNDAFFFSATEYDANNAWRLSLTYDNANVVLGQSLKANGFSIRCVRDL